MRVILVVAPGVGKIIVLAIDQTANAKPPSPRLSQKRKGNDG
jgi:hypothetical protein